MELLYQIVVFILALWFIIVWHELGHFVVAYLFKVKIITFSVGLGKPILNLFTLNKNTNNIQKPNFVLSFIPLGGYVKLLDSRVGSVSKQDLPYALDQKRPYQKILIALAGPLANFLLAWLIYLFIYSWGYKTISPVIGAVKENSVAEYANLKKDEKIIAVNGIKVYSWNDFLQQIIQSARDSIEIITQLNNQTFQKTIVDFDIEFNANNSVLNQLGIEVPKLDYKNKIGKIILNSPASLTQLQLGDEVLAINQSLLFDWKQMAKMIGLYPNQEVEFRIKRGNEILNLTVKIGSRNTSEGAKGYLGIVPETPQIPEHWYVSVDYTIFQAIVISLQKVRDDIILILNGIKKLIVGTIPLESIGGPISIFKISSNTLIEGVSTFLIFIALLNVNIAILNLLPLPVLDGGHIVIAFIEMISKRKLSNQVLSFVNFFGVMLLMSLMLLAIYNDINLLS